jgi:hypothetical protein
MTYSNIYFFNCWGQAYTNCSKYEDLNLVSHIIEIYKDFEKIIEKYHETEREDKEDKQ